MLFFFQWLQIVVRTKSALTKKKKKKRGDMTKIDGDDEKKKRIDKEKDQETTLARLNSKH